MKRPTKLSNYPWVVVRFDCTLCDRWGRYSLACLAARYGPEQGLDSLLRDLAHDCPWWNERPRKYEPRCGARLVDLERNLPPRDLPPEPVQRQRQPVREDLLNRPSTWREAVRPGPPQRPVMFSGFEGTFITLACSDCDRRETYVTAKVLAVDGDMRMDQRVRTLLPDCKRRTTGGKGSVTCGWSRITATREI